ncbi:uncharacterized protein LOC119172069 isoform X3 [Rhipicephalus microplus]|uniref:uncharacterized protein LOC119172069 isoform X3 n=1 Tax=Rhipicephalus microplus TaxID=6941 RepID=UPI003F6C1D0A
MLEPVPSHTCVCVCVCVCPIELVNNMWRCKLIPAGITAASGRVGIMELVESVSPGPVDNLNGNGQIGGLLNRLNRLLLRDEDALLRELREVLHSTHVDFFQQAVTLTRTQDVLKRAVRASSYQEVGTLTNLFTGIQRKGVPPTEDTEFARANRRRMVTVAQMQQIAQELHNDIATITPYDNDNVEEINSANKQKTLLGNALLSLAFKTVTDTADIRATKELDRFLNCECHNPKDDQWTLPAILAQAKLNKASEMRHLCGDSSRNSEAEKSQREQDIVDGVSRVIRELTDGVLGYVADCKASEASEALRDIAGRMRITGH